MALLPSDVDMTQWQARFDAKLVECVQKALRTTSVKLIAHRATGVGSQTVPIFNVPAEHRSAAQALGLMLTEQESC